MTIRDKIIDAARAELGVPYYYGGKPGNPHGLDCSGLIEVAWLSGEVWPYGHNDASAEMLWIDCPKIPWQDRLPGDAICYGTDNKAHHIVLVEDKDHIIGANHGEPFPEWDKRRETYAAFELRQGVYIKQMEAKGAMVVRAGIDYWASQRLGVIRAPKLNVSTCNCG